MAGAWYIGGDPKVYTAVTHLDNDSDRAVGVLAAAIVEVWLTSAIKTKFHKPEGHEKVLERLFEVGRPLGGFDVKIDVAYLLGLLSPDAFDDLKVMKGIRNDFAHKLEMASFKIASIKSRCFNLKLVDKKVGDIPLQELKEMLATPEKMLERGDGRFLFTGAKEALADARRRYILTAQLLSMPLSQADSPRAQMPLIYLPT
jgi:DNA-binding MltR family transcriptional regulator